jgi:hypothetical protein
MPKYDDYTQSDMDFTTRHLKQLEGGTITDVGVAVEDFNEGTGLPGDWQVLPVLVVEDKVGQQYQVVVLRDAEGNGPGWLDIHKAN